MALKITFRRVAVLLLTCLLACGMPCAAFAESASTTLTAEVPANHTLTVQADHVEVLYNGTAAASFSLVRHSEPRFLLQAETGWQITTVLYNGTDVTAQLRDGYLTLPSITEDATLQVSTTAASSPSPTPNNGSGGTGEGSSGSSGADNASATPSATASAQMLPPTGDNASLLLYLLLAFGSALGLLTLSFHHKKRED